MCIRDSKLTWACGRHHNCVAVLRVHLSADGLDGCHVLRDLRTEIGAIDHSRVAVCVHMIYTVAIESEGCAGLHCRAKHQPHNVLDVYKRQVHICQHERILRVLEHLLDLENFQPGFL